MDLFILFFLLGAGYAVHSAVEHVKGEYRESRDARVKAAAKGKPGGKLPESEKKAAVRRHAVGWWAREIGGGFPVLRTGWHTGWVAHRAALSHQRARREEARTTHLETEASFSTEIPEHRRRQAAARWQIDDALAKLPPDQRKGKKAVQEAAEAVVLPFPDRPVADAADLPVREVHPRASRPPWLDDAPPLPADAVPPQPGPYAKPQPAPAGWPTGIPRKRKSDGTVPAEPATNGAAPMTADTSYSTVLDRARAFVAQADQDQAAVRATLNRAVADADAMQAAEVDPATIGEQMDLIDRLQAVMTALAAVGEQAGVVATGVQQRHSQLAEAHADAPVRAAAREFYEEG